jgi:DHA2 family methylenomycin A resistance protein-like MFS transporter
MQPRALAPVEEKAVPSSPEWMILGAVSLCTMLAPLNSTMIVVALPHIVKDFGTTIGSGDWLITLYLIAMASCQPVAGKLGDRWGRRPLILLALLAFTAVSAGAALAPDLRALIVFRVLQAVCAGLILPNGVALVREIVPAERRASRFGLVASAAGVAAALGPPLGGVLTQLGGWRCIFAANVLLVAPALLIGWRSFPRVPRVVTSGRFDVLGSALLSVLLVALAVLLMRIHEQAIAVSVVWALLIAAVAAVFLRHELRLPDPVLQLRFFRNPTFAAGNGAIALSNLAMYTTLLAVPLLVGERTHLKPLQIGLLLAAMSATNLIAAPMGGRLSDRYGRRWPTAAGLALAVPGLLVLVIAGNSVSLGLLALSLGVAGFGFGLGWSGLQTAVVESVAFRQTGMASGLFSTSRYFGSIVGTSVLGAVVGGAHRHHDFVPIFAMAFIAAALSAVMCLMLQDRPELALRGT